ncbi:MAG: hypothetical protein IPM06_18485 [Rhizobiales bacterium]|nr:hypothetical protein [Hyphomicrobiales bacterium]
MTLQQIAEDEELASVHVHLDESATPELKSALGRMVERAKDWAARTFADKWDHKNAERLRRKADRKALASNAG